MLRVKGLHAHYGQQPVLFGLSFELNPGEAVALLGRNGMGKTATFKAILGLIPAQAQLLELGKVDLRKLPPQRRARSGIGYAAQDGRVFPDLSVLENLRLGGGRDPDALQRLLAHFPQLKDRLKQAAGTLSGGEQQMLGIVRALWGNSRLLLLDEPTEGLMPALRQVLALLLREFCGRGGSVLLAEQHVDWVRSWCDRILILERGRLVFADEAARLPEALIQRHLGVF